MVSGQAAAPRTLSERVFDALQTAIVTGDLKPGEKIREPELARRFGTSRGPLRDALRRLEARHLVINRPNSGARVVSLSPRKLVELYEVREALEGMTCRLAAANMTDEEIVDLGALLDRHEAEIGESDGSVYFQQEGDLDFHYRIADACGNELLRSALCEDHYQLMRLYRYKFASRAGRARRAVAEHRQIHDAIRARDSEHAELLMRRHIRNARLNFENHLAESARDAGGESGTEQTMSGPATT